MNNEYSRGERKKKEEYAQLTAGQGGLKNIPVPLSPFHFLKITPTSEG